MTYTHLYILYTNSHFTKGILSCWPHLSIPRLNEYPVNIVCADRNWDRVPGHWQSGSWQMVQQELCELQMHLMIWFVFYHLLVWNKICPLSSLLVRDSIKGKSKLWNISCTHAFYVSYKENLDCAISTLPLVMLIQAADTSWS